MDIFSFSGWKKKVLRFALKSAVGRFLKGVEQHHVREPTFSGGVMKFELERLEINEAMINDEFLNGLPLRLAYGTVNSIRGEIALSSEGMRNTIVEGMDFTFDLISRGAKEMRPAATSEEQQRSTAAAAEAARARSGRTSQSMTGSSTGGTSEGITQSTRSNGSDGGAGGGGAMFSSLLSGDLTEDEIAREILGKSGSGSGSDTDADDGDKREDEEQPKTIDSGVTAVSQAIKALVHSLSLTLSSVNIRIRCPPEGREIIPGEPLPYGTVELLLSLPNEVSVRDFGTNERDVGNSFKKIIKFAGIRVSVYDAAASGFKRRTRAGQEEEDADNRVGGGGGDGEEEVMEQRLSYSDIILSGSVDKMENQIIVTYEDVAPDSGIHVTPKWKTDVSIGQIHAIVGPSQLLRLSIFAKRLLDVPPVDESTGKARKDVKQDKSKLRLSIAALSLSLLYDDAAEMVGNAWRSFPTASIESSLRVRYYAVRVFNSRLMIYNYSLPTTSHDDSYFHVFDRFGGSCVKLEVRKMLVVEHRPGYRQLLLLGVGNRPDPHDPSMKGSTAHSDATSSRKGTGASRHGNNTNKNNINNSNNMTSDGGGGGTSGSWYLMGMIRTTCPMTTRLAREFGVAIDDNDKRFDTLAGATTGKELGVGGAMQQSTPPILTTSSQMQIPPRVIVRQDIRVQLLDAIEANFDVEVLERIIQFVKRMEYFVLKAANERSLWEAEEEEREVEEDEADGGRLLNDNDDTRVSQHQYHQPYATEESVPTIVNSYTSDGSAMFGSVYSHLGDSYENEGTASRMPAEDGSSITYSRSQPPPCRGGAVAFPTVEVYSPTQRGAHRGGGGSSSSSIAGAYVMIRTASLSVASLRCRVLFPASRKPSKDVYGPLTQKLFQKMLNRPPPFHNERGAGGRDDGAGSMARSNTSSMSAAASPTSSRASTARSEHLNGHWGQTLVFEVSRVGVTLPTGGADHIILDAEAMAMMRCDASQTEQVSLFQAILCTPQQQAYSRAQTVASTHHHHHHHHHHHQQQQQGGGDHRHHSSGRTAHPTLSRKQRKVLFMPPHTLEVVTRTRTTGASDAASTNANTTLTHEVPPASSPSPHAFSLPSSAAASSSLPPQPQNNHDEPFPAAEVDFRTDIPWQDTEQQEAALTSTSDVVVYLHVPEVRAELHQDDLLLLLFMAGELSDCVAVALACLDPLQEEDEGREAFARSRQPLVGGARETNNNSSVDQNVNNRSFASEGGASCRLSLPSLAPSPAATTPASGIAVRIVIGSARIKLGAPRIAPDGLPISEPLWTLLPREERVSMAEDAYYHCYRVTAGGLGIYIYNYTPENADALTRDMLVNVRAASINLDEKLPPAKTMRLRGFSPPSTDRAEPRWSEWIRILGSYDSLYNKSENNNGDREQTALTLCMRRKMSITGMSDTLSILLDRLALSHQTSYDGDNWLLALLSFVSDAPQTADRSDDDEEDDGHAFENGVDDADLTDEGGAGLNETIGSELLHSSSGARRVAGSAAAASVNPLTTRTKVSLVAKDSLIQYQPLGFVCRLAVLVPTVVVDTGVLLSTQKRAVISLALDEAALYLHNNFPLDLLQYDTINATQSGFGVTRKGVARDLENLGFILVLTLKSSAPQPSLSSFAANSYPHHQQHHNSTSKGGALVSYAGGGQRGNLLPARRGVLGDEMTSSKFTTSSVVNNAARMTSLTGGMGGGNAAAPPPRYGVSNRGRQTATSLTEVSTPLSSSLNGGSVSASGGARTAGGVGRASTVTPTFTLSPFYDLLSNPLAGRTRFLGGNTQSFLSSLPPASITVRMFDVAGKPIVVEIQKLSVSLTCACDSFYLFQTALAHYLGGLDLAFLPKPEALVEGAFVGGGIGSGRSSGSRSKSSGGDGSAHRKGRSSRRGKSATSSSPLPLLEINCHPELPDRIAEALQKSIFDSDGGSEGANHMLHSSGGGDGSISAQQASDDEFEYITFDSRGAVVEKSNEADEASDHGGAARGIRQQRDAYALARAIAESAVTAPVTVPSSNQEDDSFEIIGHAEGSRVRRDVRQWRINSSLKTRLESGLSAWESREIAREGVIAGRAAAPTSATLAQRGQALSKQQRQRDGSSASAAFFTGGDFNNNESFGGAKSASNRDTGNGSSIRHFAPEPASDYLLAGEQHSNRRRYASNVPSSEAAAPPPSRPDAPRPFDLRELISNTSAVHFSLQNPFVRQGSDGNAEADGRLVDCPQVAVEIRVKDCVAVARLYGGLDFAGLTAARHHYDALLHSAAIFTGDADNANNIGGYRATRPGNVSIEAQLFSISAQIDVFVPGMAKTMQMILKVRDARVLDHIGASGVRTVLMCSVPATHRDNDGNIFELKWVSTLATTANVTFNQQVAMEDMSIRFQPLTVNVHRRNIDLMLDFIDVSDGIVADVLQIDAKPSQLFFRRLFIHPLSITLYVTTEAKELGQALRGTASRSSVYEFANLFPTIEGSQISLRKIEILNTHIDMLGNAIIEALGDELWGFRQLYLLLCGFEVVRTVNEAGQAVAELVFHPFDYYRRDRSVVTGLAKGLSAFGRRIGAELMRVGASTTRTGQLVANVVAGSAPMPRGAQPSGASEGLVRAGEEVRRGAEETIARVCFALFDEHGRALSAPAAPFVMTDSLFRAATHILEGMRNSFRPEQRTLQNRLFKSRLESGGL